MELVSQLNWNTLLHHYEQDAQLILIEGSIVYASPLAIEYLQARSLAATIGMSWEDFLIFKNHHVMSAHLQNGRSYISQAISEYCQCKTRYGNVFDAEIRLHSFALKERMIYVLHIRNLEKQPFARNYHKPPSVQPILLPPSNYGLSNEALHHEKEILEMIALDNPLQQILQDVCDRMEHLLNNGSVCSIMLLNNCTQELELAAAPSFPEQFLTELEQNSFKCEDWICGPQFHAGECRIIEDLNQDHYWDTKIAPPTLYGLHSAWSIPIQTAFGNLLGTIDIFHPENRRPSEDEQTLVEDTLRVIALAIDKKNMEERLALSENRYRSVVTHLTEGIMMIAPGGKIITSNPSAKKILKITDIDSIDKRNNYFKTIYREDGSIIKLGADPVSLAFKTGESFSNFNMGVKLVDDSVIWILLNVQPIFEHQNPRVNHVLVSFTNITNIRETEKKLQHLATHDALTNLPNRHYLYQRLETSMNQRSKRKVAALFLDLDRFKSVNDTAGHEAGDDLLIEVSRRLSSCIRGNDMLARLGGDEFVIVVENFKNNHFLRELSDRILEQIRLPFVINDNKYHLGTSIGIAIFPHDAENATSLLRCADSAMYLAKELGRNNYQFYTKELQVRAQQRYSLERNLRSALDEGHFVLHYQPQIRLVDNRIIGAEALIRWDAPAASVVNPNEFIPFAEDIGLILPIGKWVIQQACLQAKQWQKQYDANFKIGINISPKQFQDPTFKDFLIHTLEDTGLPPSSLSLEITEGLLLIEAEYLKETFEDIRALGIQIAVDDFGTGYSSLSYLQRFPITQLKIDRSFVHEIPHNKDSAALTKAIIAMSHVLGLGVTAEGVETFEQCQFLIDAGCHDVQGFYFSPPITAEVLADMLNDQHSLFTTSLTNKDWQR